MNSKRTTQSDAEGASGASGGSGPAITSGSKPRPPGKGTGNGDPAAPQVPTQRTQMRAPAHAIEGRLALATPASGAMNWSALTATELTVAELLAAGRSIGAVAKHLDLSPATVDRHLRRIFAKLGVDNLIELARAAEASAQSARALRMVDATKRQIERDLHDGLQQHLIGLGVRLSAAELAVRPADDGLRRELHEVAEGLREVLTEVRQIAHGVDPAILREHGLGPALQTLAKHSPVPVSVVIKLPGRLPEVCESTAYFVTAEALANVAKHARAATARVTLEYEDGFIIHSIRDDGVGGADPDGPGISGLRRRAEARGGSMQLTSPPGGGTLLVIKVPFDYVAPGDGHPG